MGGRREGEPRSGAQGAWHVIPDKPCAGGFGHGHVLKWCRSTCGRGSSVQIYPLQNVLEAACDGYMAAKVRETNSTVTSLALHRSPIRWVCPLQHPHPPQNQLTGHRDVPRSRAPLFSLLHNVLTKCIHFFITTQKSTTQLGLLGTA